MRQDDGVGSPVPSARPFVPGQIVYAVNSGGRDGPVLETVKIEACSERRVRFAQRIAPTGWAIQMAVEDARKRVHTTPEAAWTAYVAACGRAVASAEADLTEARRHLDIARTFASAAPPGGTVRP